MHIIYNTPREYTNTKIFNYAFSDFQIFSTMNPQPCGACSALNQPCNIGCFWAQYIKVREDEKFRVLLRDNLDDSKVEGLRKLMVKTRIVSQQSMLIIDTKRFSLRQLLKLKVRRQLLNMKMRQSNISSMSFLRLRLVG